MNESILDSIKKMLGLSDSYDAFDTDILTNINAALFKLEQSGIGEEFFYITDSTSIWSDFLGDKSDLLGGSMTFVYLQTRIIFDPPSNSFVLEAMKSQSEELLYRLTLQVEEVYKDV